MLGKLPLTAGGFADDFEYSGHPSATPPPGGSTGWWGEISLSFFFFFFPLSGLPAGSGVLASQGDQPKKGGIFFFFSMILICVVCSINADATLRYAPLRTLSGQKNFSTSAKMSRQTVKTAALTRILHIISRSPPLRNKKKYVRSVACRRFLV